MPSVRLVTALAVTTALSSCAGIYTPPDGLPDYQANKSVPAALIGAEEGKVIEATQNWTDALRAAFWHIDQGSLMAPFDIAINIERADSDQRFFAPESISRYRYVPQYAGSYGNEHGLPVGFTKGETPYEGETYMGMTCSACHSSVITYEGTGIMIDGAPSQADFQTMFKDLTEAFTAARDNPAKFDRLAAKVGGDRAALRARLETATQKMIDRRAMNRTESAYGFGRVDAVGQIFNSVAAQNLRNDANRADPNAPVSYPHIWGTHQSDYVQWNGFAPNVTINDNIRILAPLVRNAGEVIGVFGDVQVKFDDYEKGDTYKNSIRERNLIEIEGWLENLLPPPWPEQVFGPIDATKAARGAQIYNDREGANCVECHQVLDDPLDCYRAALIPVRSSVDDTVTVGTDPGMAVNALRKAKIGPLEGRTIRRGRTAARFGEDALGNPVDEDLVLNMLVHQVYRSVGQDVLSNPVTSAAFFLRQVSGEVKEKKCDVPFLERKPFTNAETSGAYKARPLNGIWATAPFLHNGSVPTLRDLLEPPADRPKTFVLGGWEYDPGPVGFKPYSGPGAFEFDTTKKGNSNAGHIWGTDLPDDDKDALVEYMKSL